MDYINLSHSKLESLSTFISLFLKQDENARMTLLQGFKDTDITKTLKVLSYILIVNGNSGPVSLDDIRAKKGRYGNTFK